MRIIGDRLFVREITEEVTKAGIIIDERKPDKVRRGVVVYKGDEVDEEIDVGDTVFFNHYITKRISLNSEEFDVMTSGDVIAIYK